MMRIISDQYKFEQSDLLGQGVYAKVYRALSIDNKQYVALKKYKSDFCSYYFHNGGIKQKMLREVNILKVLQHKSIIKFIDFLQFKQSQQLYLITEYCNQGTLEAMISKGKILQYRVFQIFSQIVDAMVYIHDKNILHRDLKPQNIYIHNNTVKIGDFGLSRLVKIDIQKSSQKVMNILSQKTGTAYYMAPNVFNGPDYTNKCDVWSFGIMMYEILTGRKLFKHNQAELFDAHHKLKNSNFILEQKYHPFFRILEKIIVYEQDYRLSFQEIQQEIKQNFYVGQQIQLKLKQFRRLFFLYNRATLYQLPQFLINQQKIKVEIQCALGIIFLFASIGLLELATIHSQINNYLIKYQRQIQRKQLKDLIKRLDERQKKIKNNKRIAANKIMDLENVEFSERLYQYMGNYFFTQNYKVQTIQFYSQELNKLLLIVEKEKNTSQKLTNNDKMQLEELIQFKKVKELFKFQEYDNPDFINQLQDTELRFFTKYRVILKKK